MLKLGLKISVISPLICGAKHSVAVSTIFKVFGLIIERVLGQYRLAILKMKFMFIYFSGICILYDKSQIVI